MASDTENLDYNLYFVCLFDLLGQRNKLKDWERHPRNIEEAKKAFKAINDSAITIDKYRSFLNHWISESARLYKEALQKMYPGQEETILQRIPEVHLQQFSDTFVLVSPAIREWREGYRIALSNIEHVFSICSYHIISSLASEHPLRGGITVGTGVWIDDNWFYGPALAEAYDLENKVAQYPRFVVSDSVLRLFEKGTEVFNATMGLEDVLMHSPKQYLIEDDDGCWMLDFLGTRVYNSFPDLLQEVRKAYNFVEKCSEKFRDCNKLGPRYKQLQNYMQKRLQLWEP